MSAMNVLFYAVLMSVMGFIYAVFFKSQRQEVGLDIAPDRLHDLLTHKRVVLVDVRELYEHQEGCIEHSVLIPLATLSADKIPCGKEPIVFYCRSGHRSGYAVALMAPLMHGRACYSLTGGILAWRRAGYSVTCGLS